MQIKILKSNLIIENSYNFCLGSKKLLIFKIKLDFRTFNCIYFFFQNTFYSPIHPWTIKHRLIYFFWRHIIRLAWCHVRSYIKITQDRKTNNRGWEVRNTRPIIDEGGKSDNQESCGKPLLSIFGRGSPQHASALCRPPWAFGASQPKLITPYFQLDWASACPSVDASCTVISWWPKNTSPKAPNTPSSPLVWSPCFPHSLFYHAVRRDVAPPNPTTAPPPVGVAPHPPLAWT